MKIITISREFGSGGRELGKCIADILGFDYYDREIITTIAHRKGLEENYVEYALNNHQWQTVPITFRHSFGSPAIFNAPQTDLLIEQKKVIEEIAKAGKDCVIVGRNADVLLHEQNPFNIFVCADMDTKIKRCQERADEQEQLTPKEIKRNIMRIDKNRQRARFMLADGAWGHRASYHLIVNTTGWDIKQLAKPVSDLIDAWYKNPENN